MVMKDGQDRIAVTEHGEAVERPKPEI